MRRFLLSRTGGILESGEGWKFPVIASVILVLCGVFLLESWRPCFFLTDDNLTQLFPVLAEIGRDLKSGQPVFTSEYLFGGGYDLRADPTFLSVWHPLILLSSLLANTNGQSYIIELVALGHLVSIALSFSIFASWLRRHYQLPVKNYAVIALTLSYVFCGYNIIIGSSWINFLSCQVILPLFIMGLLMRGWWKGAACIALGFIHGALSSFPHALLYTLLVVTLLAVLFSWTEPAAKPVSRWIAGLGAGILLGSPLLLPAVMGFLDSPRFEAQSIGASSYRALPLVNMLPALFLGKFYPYVEDSFQLFGASVVYASALPFCFGSFVLVAALRPGVLPRPALWLAGAGLFLGALLVTRPFPVAWVLHQLPFFASGRWPFRELFIWVFFWHVLLLFCAGVQRGVTFGAALALGLGIGFFTIRGQPAPTLALMERDRRLILSGEAADYWQKVRAAHPPKTVFAAVADPVLPNTWWDQIPYSLLGAYNYPALFEFVSAGGYSSTISLSQVPTEFRPAVFQGLYRPEQVDVLRERFPGLSWVELRSMNPLRIEQSEVSFGPVRFKK